MIPLYSAMKMLFRPVKRVDFYDYYFVVSGWKTSKTIRYSDIEKIMPVKRKILYLIPQTRLSISIKGEGWIRAALGNPWNSKLKTDLYSWLLGKTRNKQS
jgi:hypothetical protein